MSDFLLALRAVVELASGTIGTNQAKNLSPAHTRSETEQQRATHLESVKDASTCEVSSGMKGQHLTVSQAPVASPNQAAHAQPFSGLTRVVGLP